MTTLSNRTVKIRKQRKCFSCYRTFEIGMQMNYWAGIVDGDFCTCYSCLACVQVMNMREDPDEEGFPEGYVFEMLQTDETPEQLVERWKKEDNINTPSTQAGR